MWICARHVLLLSLLMTLNRNLVGRYIGETCPRQQFTEYRGYGYNGYYLVYDGPWPYKGCQRLCRRYVECTTFVIKWIDKDDKFGFCGLIGYDPDKEKLNASDQHSVYGK